MKELTTYNRAAAYLTAGGLSQKEAALQVGYPDICTFSRMFRKQFGMPPGEYVRQYRMHANSINHPE